MSETSDPRIVEYIEAANKCDYVKIGAMRVKYKGFDVIDRFDTVDVTRRSLIKRYELEIRILKKEARAWEYLADGFEAANDPDPDGDKKSANRWIRLGVEGLEIVAEARKGLYEIVLPPLEVGETARFKEINPPQIRTPNEISDDNRTDIV